jgi:hypothetical protein
MSGLKPQREGLRLTGGALAVVTSTGRALAAVISLLVLAFVSQGAGLWSSLPHAPAFAVPPAAEYTVSATYAFTPFGASLAWSVAPHIALMMLLTMLAARLAGILARAGLKLRAGVSATADAEAVNVDGAEAGASVIEFALVMPLLLTILLLVFQIALLVQAKFIVNYAAFCAARSAVVTIPAKIFSQHTRRYEKSNQLDLNSPLSPKMSIIRRAAALPCVAISPPLSPRIWLTTGTEPADAAYLAPLLRVSLLFPFSAEGKPVSDQLITRASYAYDRNNTSVEVIRVGAGGGGNGQGGQQRGFSDHDLVTVRVTYRYYLTVPIVNRLLGTPYRGGLTGFVTGTGWYYSITEQYTLPIEGEPLFPPDQEPSGRSEIEQEIYE